MLKQLVVSDNRQVILDAMKAEFFKRARKEHRYVSDEYSYLLDQLQEAIIYLQEDLINNNEDTIPEATGVS